MPPTGHVTSSKSLNHSEPLGSRMCVCGRVGVGIIWPLKSLSGPWVLKHWNIHFMLTPSSTSHMWLSESYVYSQRVQKGPEDVWLLELTHVNDTGSLGALKIGRGQGVQSQGRAPRNGQRNGGPSKGFDWIWELKPGGRRDSTTSSFREGGGKRMKGVCHVRRW